MAFNLKVLELCGVNVHIRNGAQVRDEPEPQIRGWASQDQLGPHQMGHEDVPATQLAPVASGPVKNRKSVVELRQLWVPQRETTDDKGQAVASGPVVLAFQRELEAFLYKELIGTLFNAKADREKGTAPALQADRRLGDVLIHTTPEKGKVVDVMVKKVHKDHNNDNNSNDKINNNNHINNDKYDNENENDNKNDNNNDIIIIGPLAELLRQGCQCAREELALRVPRVRARLLHYGGGVRVSGHRRVRARMGHPRGQDGESKGGGQGREGESKGGGGPHDEVDPDRGDLHLHLQELLHQQVDDADHRHVAGARRAVLWPAGRDVDAPRLALLGGVRHWYHRATPEDCLSRLQWLPQLCAAKRVCCDF